MPQKQAVRENQKTPDTLPGFTIDGKHRWYEFEFEQALFVETVSVTTAGYSDYDAAKFEFLLPDGTTYADRSKIADGKFEQDLYRFAVGFRFRPDVKFSLITSQQILNVSVVGYLPEELSKLEEAITNLDEREIEVDEKYEGLANAEAAHQANVQSLMKEIESLSETKTSLEKNVATTQSNLRSLENAEVSATDRASELQATRKDVEADLEQKREERRTVLQEVSEQDKQLRRIKEEIRLFPSEISGFVQEGARNIRNYVMYSIPFVAAILYVTYELFYGAIELSKTVEFKNVDMWKLFLTRLPFVVVAVTVLQVCGLMVARFVNEIIQINKQRLNLSKLSIVAKDVTTASSAKLELSETEKFELETHLKMELLREHMKQYIGESFQYRAGKVGELIDTWTKKNDVDFEADDLPDGDANR